MTNIIVSNHPNDAPNLIRMTVADGTPPDKAVGMTPPEVRRLIDDLVHAHNANNAPLGDKSLYPLLEVKEREQ